LSNIYGKPEPFNQDILLGTTMFIKENCTFSTFINKSGTTRDTSVQFFYKKVKYVFYGKAGIPVEISSKAPSPKHYHSTKKFFKAEAARFINMLPEKF